MIALLQGAPVYGGIEDNYVRHIVEGLREPGGEEVVLVLPDVPALDPLRGLAAGNVRTVDFPSALMTSQLRLILHLRHVLRTLRPRLVHVVEVWPAGTIAARLAGVPRVLVTHHTVVLPREDNLRGRALLALSWAMRPEVIYISETNRRLHDRRLRSHVTDEAVDLERFASGIRALPSNGPVVGTTARLAPQKDQRRIIEAAPSVLARHPDTRFVLVGDGQLRGELERQVREAGLDGSFTFTGARDDVPDLLASFDVYVLPSLWEGLPHSVIEAQAAGVPVVATGVGGTPELVVHEETGLLVPTGDAAALAAAVLRLLDDRELASRLAQEARRRVSERFTPERLVAQTRAIYGTADLELGSE